MSDRPVLIIDGLNLFIRGFIASPAVSNGQHVGGITSFLRTLSSLVNKHNPKKCIVVWEGGGSLRRRQIFPEYKGKRRPKKLNRREESGIIDTVENHDWQLKTAIAAINSLPIKQIYISDCEADDIIGYLAKVTFRDENIVIASSDHDYLQLISDRILIWSPSLKAYVDEDWVFERYGIHPNNLCVARAFCGDKSDMIPGVKGVGPKVLLKYMPALSTQEIVTIDDVYNKLLEHPHRTKRKSIDAIIENIDIVKRNWKLMYLDVNNLSGSQIGKLNSSFEIAYPVAHKMNFLRTMIKAGINMIDIDRLFTTINVTLRENNT